MKTFVSTMAASVFGLYGGPIASRCDSSDGGMPGFGGGDFGGAPDSAQLQGSTSEAITTGVAIIVLLLAAALVTFYKQKRL